MLRRAPLPGRAIAPSKGDHHDHDRAGVPRQRASMRVLGRVGERAGKQRRFLCPRRDLGGRRHLGREIDRRAGNRGNPRTFTPSGGCGLAVDRWTRPLRRVSGSLAMLAAIAKRARARVCARGVPPTPKPVHPGRCIDQAAPYGFINAIRSGPHVPGADSVEAAGELS